MPAHEAAAAASPVARLEITGLEAWYGESQALHGMRFEVVAGQVTTLLGRNGAGKTTTLKSIMGMVARRRGSIRVDGAETIRLPSRMVALRGVALVPEERGIFASLSVEENLFLPPRIGAGGLSIERIFGLFPNLSLRLANPGGKLSGGEQQMLAIARVLRTGATILLLDEPTEGLAPVIVEQIANTIRELKQEGFTILLVEQNLQFAASIADRHYLVEQGQVVDRIDAADFDASQDKLQRYLGV